MGITPFFSQKTFRGGAKASDVTGDRTISSMVEQAIPNRLAWVRFLHPPQFMSSSEVEQFAVNEKVLGSIPSS